MTNVSLKIFLSYHFQDERFVGLVKHFLARQSGFEIFFWSEDGRQDDFSRELESKLREATVLLLFVGTEAGKWQRREAQFFEQLKTGERQRTVIQLGETIPEGLQLILAEASPIRVAGRTAYECSREITRRLGMHWVEGDGLPDGYPFSYEKDIIEEYASGAGGASLSRLVEGCPATWPPVPCVDRWYQNPLNPEDVGVLSGEETSIIVDTHTSKFPRVAPLKFLEARPRTMLSHPSRQRGRLGVGILVSGGIAPGINAVIDGIVKRHTVYRDESERRRQADLSFYRLEIKGYVGGFQAFFEAGDGHFTKLDVSTVEPHAEEGGSLLGTSRPMELLAPDPIDRLRNLERVVQRLVNDGVDILYVIGGDGSMRAAHAIHVTARRTGAKLSLVGIPKTMDNDILWVWQSFGFLSAVEKARETVLLMKTEVSSNPRVAIVQLFGSDSGFVASHAGYSTACDLVLIPEDPLTMKQISDHVFDRLERRIRTGMKNPHSLVVMAETALPEDADEYLDSPIVHLSEREKQNVREFLSSNRRVTGQTPDELRTAALKIVSRILQANIREFGQSRGAGGESYWSDYRVLTSEPRHLIRSIRPSVSDVIFGERLATLAVDNAMAGYSDFMVSQWLTEFVLVPLELVVLGRKRVPVPGIFWKSVRAKTGQPSGPDVVLV